MVISHRLTPPKETRLPSLGYCYRYEVPSVAEAIVQKLAFTVSGLRASMLLLEAGFLTEQANLSRAINEAQEDITFLVLSSLKAPYPDLLNRYLASFFAEDATREALAQGKHPKGRALPTRKDIQNYIARHDLSGTSDPHGAVGHALAISHILSSFTHGASPNIMQSYDRRGRSFFTNGFPPSSPFVASHVNDFENYVFRGLVSAALAAKAIMPHDFANACFERVQLYEANFLKRRTPRRAGGAHDSSKQAEY